MPITIELVDGDDPGSLDAAFARFTEIDRRFSPYRDDSELGALNAGRISRGDLSDAFRQMLRLAEEARELSGGYFDVTRPDGRLDPSGVVKGWAVKEAAGLLQRRGHSSFFVDAGGDIQVAGTNARGQSWRVGIRNSFAIDQIIKVICPGTRGVATSGSYIRGDHIYDPHRPGHLLDDIVSLTVVPDDVLEADILATAAFAMGREGLGFLRSRPGVDAYAVDRDGVATFTPGFTRMVQT